MPIYNPQYSIGKSYSNSHKPNDSGTNYGKVGYSKKNNITTRYPRSIIKFNIDMKKAIHPTQKPVELCQYLIKTYTKENETILDNCSGSGTTGVACKYINRKCILIEKDEKYFQMGIDRINNPERQLKEKVSKYDLF
jgi:site-specific DNA-methyltransferase (adenine-specific)